MFGLFGKKKQVAPDFAARASLTAKVAATLWHLTQSDPDMLAGPYARIVLTDGWNIGVASDRRDPAKLLRPEDVCCVFLREDQAALDTWMGELRSNSSSPVFQQIATDEYAKTLVRALMSNVQVID